MDDDDDSNFSCDIVYERVQAVRNIALDLETATDRTGRGLLKQAAKLALQHLALKSAPIVELVSHDGKLVKERPL